MAKRILYLVRHGQFMSTSAPADEPDGGLTPLGEKQATLTAERLHHFPISTIHYSPAQRTTETATILAAQIPADFRPSALLRECIPSVPEAVRNQIVHIPAEFIKRGGLQAQQAFETFFKPVPDGEPDQHEIIVSHGNLISHLVCRVLQAPPDAWVNTLVYHCGISEITVGAPDRFELVCHNDTGHLPAELRTEW